ncbi:MAG TPA: ThiF family adenylyltransferase [Gemmatimonadaceae bacterium]|nr:ThiF family adenylyltransferase [Gemmatimonadaceae bacterium]
MSERSTRQSFLGESSDATLGALRVGIVGLGGGGSHVAQQLAHVGVGNYVLVDPDRIESSNLNRLVGGTVADLKVRRWKTTIAARQIRRVLPRARIVEIKEEWQGAAESFRDCDLVLGCLDSFAGRRELEEAARRFLIPYIDVGMDVIKAAGRYAIVGQIALSMPGRPCLRCLGVVRDTDVAAEAQAYGAAGGKPQVVWPNGLLASVAVGLAVQLVCPWHEGRNDMVLLEYDGNVNTVAVSSVLGDVAHDCPHFTEVARLGDPWFSVADVHS